MSSLPSIVTTWEVLCRHQSFAMADWVPIYNNILLYLPGRSYRVVQMRRDHDTTNPRKSCRRTLSLLSLLLYIIITRHPTAR